LLQYLRYPIRIFAIAGILFLYLSCAEKSKSWNFDDLYSLDVRLLDTRDWLVKTKKEIKDLNKIMKPQLKYYLKNDFQVYEKLNPHYESLQFSVDFIDSIMTNLDSLVSKMKGDPSDSLDTVPNDTTKSYRSMIQSDRKKIKKSLEEYFKSLKKLRKGFKLDKKILLFIDEESLPLKQSLFELKYKREAEISVNLNRFNKELNKALFISPNSTYSKHIIKISKTIEKYRLKLDAYEKFLSNIDHIARKEAGGYVLLIPKNSEKMKYIQRYEEGMKEYLEILVQIRRISESI